MITSVFVTPILEILSDQFRLASQLRSSAALIVSWHGPWTNLEELYRGESAQFLSGRVKSHQAWQGYDLPLY